MKTDRRACKTGRVALAVLVMIASIAVEYCSTASAEVCPPDSYVPRKMGFVGQTLTNIWISGPVLCLDASTYAAPAAAMSHWGTTRDPAEANASWVWEDLPLVVRQNALDDYPPLVANDLEGFLGGKDAVSIWSHGGGGGFISAWFSSDEAAQGTAQYLWDHGWTRDEVGWDGAHLWSWTACWWFPASLFITTEGIRNHFKNVLGEGALVDGQYCESLTNNAFAEWGAAAMAGYNGNTIPLIDCPSVDIMWSRLGCFERKNGHSLNRAISGNINKLGGDWVFSCGVSCDRLGVLFSNVGAFADTAFCVTMDEHNTSDFLLRGFASAASYPGDPDTLGTVQASGGDGVMQAYKVTFSGSYALFDWVEREGDGRHSRSSVFSVETKPTWFDSLYQCLPAQQDTLSTSESVSAAPNQTPNIYNEQECAFYANNVAADILVYAIDQELGELVANGIRATDSTLRVRMVLGVESSAQACHNEISATYFANEYLNQYCTPVTPYPVAPGPEVYLVGSANSIHPAEFEDVHDTCSGNLCDSDYLLYDVVGEDGIPDGPISRIPFDNDHDVITSTIAAREFSLQQNVAPPKALLLSGDYQADTLLVPSTVMTAVGQTIMASGIETYPLLRQVDYPHVPGGAQMAVRDRINAGVREVFAFGGNSDGGSYIGQFLNASGPSSYTRKQRVVMWSPGCMIHSRYFVRAGDEPLVSKMLAGPLSGTVVAASVSHMDTGWEHQHRYMARYLADARRNAGLSGAKSVARVAYDAVRAYMENELGNAHYPLSTSAWGSYVVLPRSSGLGEIESVQSESSQWFRVTRAVVNSRAEFILDVSTKAAEIAVTVYDVAGRLVWRSEIAEGVADEKRIVWDCRGMDGNRVPSGVYFGRATTKRDSSKTRMASVKFAVLR